MKAKRPPTKRKSTSTEKKSTSTELHRPPCGKCVNSHFIPAPRGLRPIPYKEGGSREGRQNSGATRFSLKNVHICRLPAREAGHPVSGKGDCGAKSSKARSKEDPQDRQEKSRRQT